MHVEGHEPEPVDREQDCRRLEKSLRLFRSGVSVLLQTSESLAKLGGLRQDGRK